MMRRMSAFRRLVPRTLRVRLITAAALFVVLAGSGVAVIYLVVFGTSSPAPLQLSTASPSAGVQSTKLDPSQLAGTWSVGSGSVVGYRVRETLAFLQAPSDAVGRTSKVTGTVTLGGTADALSVTAASFTADVSTLTSDRSMRDQRIHGIGLESDRFPTATFELTQPASLPATASNGQPFQTSITGKLTIHGVTKQVTIAVQAQLSGSAIQVVGSITFPWSDFGMQAPNVAGFVSVTGQTTMEFDLHLRHG
jgi:polyisoprenoid-binding protein YceI